MICAHLPPATLSSSITLFEKQTSQENKSYRQPELGRESKALKHLSRVYSFVGRILPVHGILHDHSV